MMLFDLRRDVRRCVYWLLTFVQFVVVPAGLRRINEPLGSLQSSYTLAEMEGMLRASPFDNWHVKVCLGGQASGAGSLAQARTTR